MPTADLDALIVKNLLELERAADRMLNYIQIAVAKRIDEACEDFVTSETGWTGKFDSEGNKLWFARNSWRVEGSDLSSDKFYAWYEWNSSDAGMLNDEWINEFWLTQLCGLGAGPIGLRWCVDPGSINMNKTGWKRYLCIAWLRAHRAHAVCWHRS